MLPHARHHAYIQNEMENPSDFRRGMFPHNVKIDTRVEHYHQNFRFQNEGLGSVWDSLGPTWSTRGDQGWSGPKGRPFLNQTRNNVPEARWRICTWRVAMKSDMSKSHVQASPRWTWRDYRRLRKRYLRLYLSLSYLSIHSIGQTHSCH